MDQTKKLKGNKSFLRQNWKNNIPEPVGYSKSSSKRKVHSNKCLHLKENRKNHIKQSHFITQVSRKRTNEPKI